MKVFISGLMGPGTLEAKLESLSEVDKLEEIIFIRKQKGPSIPKLRYLVLPSLSKYKLFNVLFTPLVLIYQILKNKPELIIGYHILPYAYFVAFSGWITKTPYIIGQTGLLIQKTAEKSPFIRKTLKLLFRGAHQVNCPGKASVKFWSSLYPSLNHKFVVLHSTINTIKYSPIPNIPKIYDFIFLGRLASIKNIDKIISGFHLLLQKIQNQDKKLVIVGDGPERGDLEKQVTKLGLQKQIIFTGFTDNPEFYLNQSEFLVMASKSEGLPTAMMQAMACEVIPITNLVGNIPDLVQDEKTGVIFDLPIQESIASSMTSAMKMDESKRKILKKNCRHLIVQKHSNEYSALRWKSVLDKL